MSTNRPKAARPTNPKAPAGGSYLVEPAEAHEIFVPEDFDEELRAIGQTAQEFATKEILPQTRAMESKEGKAAKLPIQILRKSAELGFCMIDIPEEYGGLDMGVLASILLTEKMGVEGAFSVTFGAHVGIGTLPIVYFGSEETKARYLPKLATAEYVGAYCLSEPGSGSDALGARTKAVLNEAGTHYVLNGTKMWITNGAWADSYVIFAQVDGDKFTGFVVERGFDGLSPGPEEHKLGLRGSSTTTINLEDVHVPVENVLGEVGKGHKIAFHILNVGRFKLGAGCVGGLKYHLGLAAKYALDRKQFNTPIAKFGAIRTKLARMAALTWAAESLNWRLGGYMGAAEEAVAKDDPKRGDLKRDIIEEYAIESSISKVFTSEALAWTIDEALQIHGGAGFVEDFEVEKGYRDNRVNRIFEGTNEINRLLIPGMILKKTMKGELPLLKAVQTLHAELEATDYAFAEDASLLEQTGHASALIKKLTLLASDAATKKYMMALKDKQEILLHLADLAIAAYAVDSGYGRARVLAERGAVDAEGPQVAAAALFASEALDAAITHARQVILSAYQGEARKPWLAKLAKLSQPFDVDRVALGEQLAERTLEAEGYGLANY